MKKYLIVVVSVLLLLSFSACSEPPDYDDGWNDGYDAGYDAGFFKGYDTAEDEIGGSDDDWEYGRDYEDSSTSIWEIEEAASWYASEKTGWSVYEASENVSLYLDGEKTITEEEYKQSVLTLKYFYEYFEQHEYE